MDFPTLSVLSIVLGGIGNSYLLVRVRQSIQAGASIRLGLSIAGSVIGISAIVLHVLSFFNLRMIPVLYFA